MVVIELTSKPEVCKQMDLNECNDAFRKYSRDYSGRGIRNGGPVLLSSAIVIRQHSDQTCDNILHYYKQKKCR